MTACYVIETGNATLYRALDFYVRLGYIGSNYSAAGASAERIFGKIASSSRRAYYRWLLASCAFRSDFIELLALSLSPKRAPHSRRRLNSYHW
ncbi:MAG: hypothetical protein ACHP7O_01730 [Burkholderiales bacterium]